MFGNLSEEERRYYLDVMGVQVWSALEEQPSQIQDPEIVSRPVLDITKKIIIQNESRQNNPSQDESSQTQSTVKLLLVLHASLSDDEQGLLTKMLSAIKLDRNDVVMHTLPETDALSNLQKQVSDCRPSQVFVMGEKIMRCLISSSDSFESLRSCEQSLEGVSFFASFSAQDLLVDPTLKKLAWHDLQQLQKRLSS